MAKTDSDRYELTDADKRDLIKLIESGKPLPEKYRFILFDDKHEVELVWNGNTFAAIKLWYQLPEATQRYNASVKPK